MDTFIVQHVTSKAGRGSESVTGGAATREAAAAPGDEDEAMNPLYNALDFRSLIAIESN
jgi:hypothetical protein